MASYTKKSAFERLERFEDSWETNAPDKTEFGGVTKAEIKTAVTASVARKNAIALARAHVKSLVIADKDATKADMTKCDFVVDAVVGDRDFGPDSALYAGFGYIRESEKKKGGGKKPTTPAA